jgi:hypothetical protein
MQNDKFQTSITAFETKTAGAWNLNLRSNLVRGHFILGPVLKAADIALCDLLGRSQCGKITRITKKKREFASGYCKQR